MIRVLQEKVVFQATTSRCQTKSYHFRWYKDRSPSFKLIYENLSNELGDVGAHPKKKVYSTHQQDIPIKLPWVKLSWNNLYEINIILVLGEIMNKLYQLEPFCIQLFYIKTTMSGTFVKWQNTSFTLDCYGLMWLPFEIPNMSHLWSILCHLLH